jgi:WD40 repeat protein/tRNA A-37 threonylcarbamoyl transferase component Bud32
LPRASPEELCPRCLLAGLLNPAHFSEELETETDTRATESKETKPAPIAPNPSRRIGDYDVIEQIGQGGMGIIFKARQRGLNRIVALKLVRAGSQSKPAESIARFRTEASAAARLHHPHIVSIYEIGAHEGQHFFSMEWVAGESLAQALINGPWPPIQAANLLKTVAEAIHFAHQQGVLHRDLKPANILLDQQKKPHVADFGLAKILQSDSDLTLSGAAIGTPQYMPPEQASGKSAEVGVACDVYSLGAVLYELLTGRPPFRAATPLETMKLVVEQEPVPPRVLNPAIPSNLQTICLKCLAKQASNRYGTALALAEDLGRFIEGEPILARPASSIERAWRWCRRKPALAMLAATPVIIILVLLIMGDKVRIERNNARQQAQLTRLNLYAADMQVAQGALEDGNVALARKILGHYRPLPGEPDLRGFEWHYLWQRARSGQMRVLRGHTRPLLCVTFSPDGNLLASSEDGAVANFWNTSTWRPGKPIDGSGPEDNRYRWLSFSRHSSHLVISDSYGGGPIYELATASPSFWLNMQQPVAGVSTRALWSPNSDKIAFSATNQQGEPLIAVLDWAALQNSPSPFFTNGAHVLVQKRTETNSRFQGTLFQSLHGAPLCGALADRLHSFTAQDHLLIGRNKELYDWDPQPGQEPVHIPSAHHFDYCERSQDGRLLAGYNSELKDRHYVLLDEYLPGRTNFWEMLGHDGDVRAIAFSPDGRRLLSASADHTARIWDPATRQTLTTLRGHADEVSCIAWSPNGKFIATGSKDRTVMIWAADEVHELDLVPEPLTSAYGQLLLSADGTSLVATAKTNSPELGVWNLSRRQLSPLSGSVSYTPLLHTGRELFTINWITNGQSGPQVAPKNTMVFQAELRRWDLAQKPQPPSLYRSLVPDKHLCARHASAIWAISGGLQWLALASPEGPVNLWSLASQSTIPIQLPATNRPISHLSFSSSGTTLAIVHPDRSKGDAVTIWLLMDGVPRLIGAIDSTTTINELAWAPDDATIALACEDHTIQVWDAKQCRLLQTLEGHKLAVAAIAFSTDGRTLASGDGRTLKLWHSGTGREMLTIYSDSKIGDPLRWLAFTSDNTLLLAADQGGRVQFFRAPMESHN